MTSSFSENHFFSEREIERVREKNEKLNRDVIDFQTKMENGHSVSPGWITLNVGGTSFLTTKVQLAIDFTLFVENH